MASCPGDTPRCRQRSGSPVMLPDQRAIRTVYMRGGTSRALIFRQSDLPSLNDASDRSAWNTIFAAALGSPDPTGRQLNGMGGGVSSLSKIAVVGPSTRPDADVDFTFGQVAIDSDNVSYKGNCGNISAAIGAFAVDEGLVAAPGHIALVRIHNTNTGKIIHAEFPMAGGKAAVAGDCVIQGVAGSGAMVKLRFLDPGGAVTGQLFPSGHLREMLAVPSLGELSVSMLDAANPVVFVDTKSLGINGNETPATIGSDASLMQRLDALRVAAALAMRVAASSADAREKTPNLPLVAIVSPAPADGSADITVRMISAGLPHKAIPLTGAMCVAIAARIPGTLVHDLLSSKAIRDLRIAHASGVLAVAARVSPNGVASIAQDATVYRTARRLMDGQVFVPH